MNETNTWFKRSLLIATILTVGIATPALAHGAEDSSNTTNASNVSANATHSDSAEPALESHDQTEQAAQKARIEAKLDDKLDAAHKQACSAHSAEIDLRANNFDKHANGLLAVFDSIAKRVEDFAVNKGKKPSNHDALVADIAAKRQLVVDDLATMKTDVAAFDCTSNNPRSQLNVILADAKTVRAALKDHRTAVLNLIKAVRNSNGSAE